MQRLVYFDYRRGRGREGSTECLKDFRGYLQTDGYVAYEAFAHKEGITLLNCMAHSRRMFDKAKENDANRSEHVLLEMQQLYEVEAYIRENGLTEEQALALRQEKAVPILKKLKQWMLKAYREVTPASPIGKALSYSLERWEKLCLYTTNGKLQIDENTIRPVALGRKNYLFAGNDEAAKRTAMLYSFMGTCKLNKVNPYDWMVNVLEKLPEYPINKIQELLPHNWKSQ